MAIIILTLLIIGLVLIVVELIFIPGTTLVGLLGFLFTIAGIVASYRHYGSETGFYILAGTSVLTILLLIYSFRSNSWSKFALKTSINSKVNVNDAELIHEGDVGLAISALRPFGKGEFDSRQYEVKTTGQFVDSGSQIKVLQVSSNQIIVEPIQ